MRQSFAQTFACIIQPAHSLGVFLSKTMACPLKAAVAPAGSTACWGRYFILHFNQGAQQGGGCAGGFDCWLGALFNIALKSGCAPGGCPPPETFGCPGGIAPIGGLAGGASPGSGCCIPLPLPVLLSTTHSSPRFSSA